MFMQNLHINLKYALKAHCCSTFIDLVEKGVIIEKTLIAKGEIKTYTKTQNSKGTSNDGIIDVKAINKIGPTLTLKAPNMNNNTPYFSNQAANMIQNNQGQGPPRQPRQYP